MTAITHRWDFVLPRLVLGALILAFAAIDLKILFVQVLPYNALGGDGLLYSLGALAWLQGRDPYVVVANGVVLVAPPPSLLPFVLTAFAPESIARLFWVAVGLGAIAWTVIRLRLPIWCVLFPPSVFAALHGSIETVMVLCVAVGPRALGPVLKVYGAVPLVIERRWRDLARAALILFITVPVLPWAEFLAHRDELVPRAVEQTFGGYSAFTMPVLAVITVLALLTFERRALAFSIVPALWPFTAPQYAAMMLPVIDRIPIAAAISSVPLTRFVVPIGILAEALAKLASRRLLQRHMDPTIVTRLASRK